MKAIYQGCAFVSAFVLACGGGTPAPETPETPTETTVPAANSAASDDATAAPLKPTAPASLGPHGTLVPTTKLAFSSDDTLTADSAAGIASVAALLADKPYLTTVRVEGHVEGAKGQASSEARARAVAKALVAQGVDCKRLIAVGFGATKPVSAAGSVDNTRIELVTAALRDRAIGGMPLDGGGHSAGDTCK